MNTQILKKNLPMLVFAMLMTSNAFAANANLSAILDDPKFKIGITLGFSLFTVYEWFKFFSTFNLATALSNIILPVLLVFLTFKWGTVLEWVGLK